MKKKTLTIIIALACAVALALGCIVAHAVTSDRSKVSEQEQDASARVDAVNEQEQDDSEKVDAVNEQEQDDSEKVDAVNDEVINTIRNRSYGDETSLYKYCCAHASDEQRRQLESFEMGYKGATSELLREGYIRQIETIMGALPSDTPRLTVEQARSIYFEVRAEGYGLGSRELEMELIRRYNEIAGAPDYDGGCGEYITVYSCNPEFTEGIIIVCGSIGIFNPSLTPYAGYIDIVE